MAHMDSPSQNLRSRRTAPVSASAPAQPNAPTRAEVEEIKAALLPEPKLAGRQALPWTPSFSLAVRLLLFIRVLSAMHVNVTADCDEVFNFAEPLHFLQYGTGFQTWEHAPQYAIRSWAYVLDHYLPGRIGSLIFPHDKRMSFFFLRIAIGIASTLEEAALYRRVATTVSARAGRYMLVFLLASAGMWNAATTLLPSTLALHLVNVAYISALKHQLTDRRTYFVTAVFAVSAVLGWPFSAALAIPFFFEELYWGRFVVLLKAGILSSLVAIPIAAIDSFYYGRPVLVAWNIIRYNVVGGKSQLYGVESPSYYLVNGFLNFNIVLPLALAALPAVAITYVVDRKRVDGSKFTFLAFRLLPVYVWFAILSLQPHKEERFLFPAYGLICFNAAVTLFIARGWLEEIYVRATGSAKRAVKSPIFNIATTGVCVVFAVLSVSRIAALRFYYNAPIDVVTHLQYTELPRVLLRAYPDTYPTLAPLIADSDADFAQAVRKHGEQIVLDKLRPANLTVCWGKEWFRYPSSYFVPSVVQPRFVKSAFAGIIPKQFAARELPGGSLFDTKATRLLATGFNDQNTEELESYVPIDKCDYLIDVDYAHRFSAPSGHSDHILEPRHVRDTKMWERVVSFPFLDNAHSHWLTRAFYLPIPGWTATNAYGDYSLLRRRR